MPGATGNDAGAGATGTTGGADASTGTTGTQTTLLDGSAGAAGGDANTGATGSAGDAGAKAAAAAAAAKTAEAAKATGTAALPDTFEFKLPEGLDAKSPALASTLPELKGLAKELGLTPESAQKLGDKLFASPMFKAMQDIEATVAANKAKQLEYVAAVKADAEVGGAKFEASAKLANVALEKLGGPELRAAINQAGLGNHPLMFKALVRAGNLLSEDRVGGNAKPNGANPNATAVEVMAGSLYDHPSSKQA